MPIQHLDPRISHDGAPPSLQVQTLHFTYPDGTEALRGVTLTLQAGEKVALVGPNGAGKSTLMMHLNGLLGHVPRADAEATVTVGGMPLLDANLGQIRARIGLVFQNPDDQLFSPTVFDDVAFGPLHMGLPEEEVRQRTAQALAQVGMTGAAARLSHHLSLGQKKRVAIATVLSMSPEILVLDEPTAGLDPRSRRELIALLHALPQTMLIATHDLGMARNLLPRTVVMDGGKVVADGATADLLNDARLLAAHGLDG